jgi:SHS2 domain-containing protein
MKYRFLPHTADAKFQAFGKSLEEAFANAAYAMTSIITDDKIKSKVKHKISIKSEDEKALLYDFLEKLIFLIDTRGFLLSKVTDLTIKKSAKSLTLTAAISGDNHPSHYQTKTTIKAVTYQQMFVKKNKIWTVQVIVDI